MRVRTAIISIAAAMFLLSIIDGPAYSQSSAAVQNYKLKKLSLEYVLSPETIECWTITGKKASLLAVTYFDDVQSNKYGLIQYALNHKGKTAVSRFGMELGSGGTYNICAAELSSGGSISPTWPNTVFYFMAVAPYDELNRAFVIARGINAAGEMVFDDLNYADIMAPADKIFSEVTINAALGPNTIGVAFSFQCKDKTTFFNDLSLSQAYFFETDLSGNLLGEVSQLKLPKGGTMKFFRTGRPAHNGAGWMVPVVNTSLRKVSSGGPFFKSLPLSCDLYVYSITGSTANRKAKLRRLARDQQRQYSTYNAAFLPAESGTPGHAAAGGTLNLFYSHKAYIKAAEQRMDLFTVDYGIMPVDRLGKKAGAETVVQIPDWDHKMPYDDEKYVDGYQDNCSNPLPGEKGTFYLAQGRTVRLDDGAGNFDIEQEFSVYSFDRATGETETIAQGANGWEGEFMTPHLRWFRGKLAIINEFKTKGRTLYFSTIKP